MSHHGTVQRVTTRRPGGLSQGSAPVPPGTARRTHQREAGGPQVTASFMDNGPHDWPGVDSSEGSDTYKSDADPDDEKSERLATPPLYDGSEDS